MRTYGSATGRSENPASLQGDAKTGRRRAGEELGGGGSMGLTGRGERRVLGRVCAVPGGAQESASGWDPRATVATIALRL